MKEMMINMKTYIVFGIIVCALFFAAGTKGFAIFSMTQSGKWGPAGHSQYHK